MEIFHHTRLRYVQSKDLNLLMNWFEVVGHKVELKFKEIEKGKHRFYYVLPENKQIKDHGNVDLDS